MKAFNQQAYMQQQQQYRQQQEHIQHQQSQSSSVQPPSFSRIPSNESILSDGQRVVTYVTDATMAAPSGGGTIAVRAPMPSTPSTAPMSNPINQPAQMLQTQHQPTIITPTTQYTVVNPYGMQHQYTQAPMAQFSAPPPHGGLVTASTLAPNPANVYNVNGAYYALPPNAAQGGMTIGTTGVSMGGMAMGVGSDGIGMVPLAVSSAPDPNPRKRSRKSTGQARAILPPHVYSGLPPASAAAAQAQAAAVAAAAAAADMRANRIRKHNEAEVRRRLRLKNLLIDLGQLVECSQGGQASKSVRKQRTMTNGHTRLYDCLSGSNSCHAYAWSHCVCSTTLCSFVGPPSISVCFWWFVDAAHSPNSYSTV